MMPAIVERPPMQAIASLVEVDAYAAQQADMALRGLAATSTLDEAQQAVYGALHGTWTDFRALIAAAVEQEREDAARLAEEERGDR